MDMMIICSCILIQRTDGKYTLRKNMLAIDHLVNFVSDPDARESAESGKNN